MRLGGLRWASHVLGVALLSAGLAGLGYLALFAALVSEPRASSIREQFLMHAPGPRMIIEGGSNGLFGLDATVLGKALNRVGLVASDSASYNGVHKAWRLLAWARPGDLVLMSLEWNFYDDPDQMQRSYLEEATTVVPTYYRALPWRERLRIAATLPLGEALGIMTGNLHQRFRPAAEPVSLVTDLHQAITSLGFNGSALAAPPHDLLPEARARRCVDYLASQSGRFQRLPDRERLQPLLAVLGRLRVRDVQVVFVPPVVAGEGCYPDPAELHRYVEALRGVLAEAGFRYLGDPLDFAFGSEATTNTYYHVSTASRVTATQRLLPLLREAGLAAPSPPEHGLAAALVSIERQQNRAVWPDTVLPAGREIPGNAVEVLAGVAGWWDPSPAGRWSRGGEAVLRFRPPPGIRSLTLRLATFAKPQSLRLQVGTEVPVSVLVQLGATDVEVPLPAGADRVELVLRPDVDMQASPQSLSVGVDPRTLGVMLLGVTAHP